jgi:hypothetical protein
LIGQFSRLSLPLTGALWELIVVLGHQINTTLKFLKPVEELIDNFLAFE